MNVKIQLITIIPNFSLSVQIYNTFYSINYSYIDTAVTAAVISIPSVVKVDIHE